MRIIVSRNEVDDERSLDGKDSVRVEIWIVPIEDLCGQRLIAWSGYLLTPIYLSRHPLLKSGEFQ